jgi:hypothetical protein
VYGGFTLLVRSSLGILMMNLLSAFTLPLIFTVPVIFQAGAYFDFQPYIGISATILIGIIQAWIYTSVIAQSRILSFKGQYIWSSLIAIAFAVLLTVIALVPVKPWTTG